MLATGQEALDAQNLYAHNVYSIQLTLVQMQSVTVPPRGLLSKLRRLKNKSEILL